MTPRLGLYVACVGFVLLALCTAATIAEIMYDEGPPEKNWVNHGVWMDNISLVWVPIAITQRETRVGNLALLFLLYGGGLLGLTVMAVGLAMAGAGGRVQAFKEVHLPSRSVLRVSDCSSPCYVPAPRSYWMIPSWS